MSQPLLKLKDDYSNSEERKLPDGFLEIHIPERLKKKLEVATNATIESTEKTDHEIISEIALSLKAEPALTASDHMVKKKRFGAEYYFRTKNHQELFKTGCRFSADYQNGQKSFAFSGKNSCVTLEQTLLGLSAYFNYHHDVKVTLVVKSLVESTLLKSLAYTHKEIRSFKNDDLNYEVTCCDGLEIIELSSITNICSLLSKDETGNFLSQLDKESEVIFWEIPFEDDGFESVEVNFSMMMQIKSVSIIAERLTTTHRDMQQLLSYFSKYGVHIKGVILGDKRKRVGKKCFLSP